MLADSQYSGMVPRKRDLVQVADGLLSPQEEYFTAESWASNLSLTSYLGLGVYPQFLDSNHEFLSLQGLFHPARKVRDVYWRIYNSLYIASQVKT